MTENINLNQNKVKHSIPKDAVNKILIANLGANKYYDTVYMDENGNEFPPTPFSFDAVAKQEVPNKLILIGTRRSFWDEVVKWYANGDDEAGSSEAKLLVEKEVDYVVEQPFKRIFYKPLALGKDGFSKVEEYIRKRGGFDRVKIVLVPNGVEKDEQKEYFEKLREAIEDVADSDDSEKTEVIYDVSNGFRSMPLYIMMLVRYFDLLKGHNFEFKAYYGNYELKSEYKNRAPLVNLTIVPEMTNWINALHDFLEYGSVKTLCHCLEKEEDSSGKVRDMIEEFLRFDSAMNSNNLHYMMQGIVYITGERGLSTGLEDNYKILDINAMPLSEQARLMIQEIQKSYRERFCIDIIHSPEWHTQEAYLLEKIAELHTDLGNYGDAAIAFQEGLVTFVMEGCLREYLTRNYNLGEATDFYEYIHDYSNRHPVKQHYDGILNERESKELPANRFEETYRDIKDKIRNAKAHFSSNEGDVVTVEQMESWLYHDIGILLKEMKNISLPDEEQSEIKERFSDYEARQLKALENRNAQRNTKKKFFKKIFVQTFSGTFTLRSEKEVFDKDVQGYMDELRISKERLSKWHHEIGECGREEVGDSSDIVRLLNQNNRLLAAQTYGEWAANGRGKVDIDNYLNTLHKDALLKERLLSVVRDNTDE